MSGRYDLRSRGYNPHVQTVTPEQRHQNTVAAGFSNNYPGPNPQTIGIDRRDNACFMNTTLQILLHLPKFIDWVNTHNVTRPDGSIQNPCAPITRPPPDHVGCPACRFKNLIQRYWVNPPVHANTVGPIQHQDPILRHFRALAHRSVAANPNLPDPNPNSALPQSDVGLFLQEVLRVCYESTNQYPTSTQDVIDFVAWTDGYQALFFIRFFEKRYTHCSVCPNQPTLTNTPPHNDLGIPFQSFNLTGDDNLREAIDRDFKLQLQNFRASCPGCQVQATTNQSTHIQKGPEYLMINLAVAQANGAKNFTPIQIPEDLNLTKYQADTSTALKYRIISAGVHLGDTANVGHWNATVTSPGNHIFGINDDVLARAPSRYYLRSNPRASPPGTQARQVALSQPTGIGRNRKYTGNRQLYTAVLLMYARDRRNRRQI